MHRRLFQVILGGAVVTVMVALPAAEAGAQATPKRDPPQQTEPARPRAATPPSDATREAVPRGEAKPADEDGAQRRAVPRTTPAPRSTPEAQRRPSPSPRREPPRRVELPPPYRVLPHPYAFPPVDVRLGFYYHPYFGFYYGPYYGPYYPYPGPYPGHARYSASAIRTRVKPVETEVYVNGYYAGIADDFDGIFQRLYLPFGQHTISLRLAGHRSFEQRVYVGPGDTFELTHQMQPLRSGETSAPPPPPGAVPDEWTQLPSEESSGEPVSPFGILGVRIEPSDARIYVDGEAWATAPGSREFVVHLPAGWHQLEVRKEGYQTFSTKIELTEGQSTRLNVTLVP